MERKCLFSLLIFFLAHQLNYIVASPKTNIFTDKSALLALKSSITNDPHNILASNWSSMASTHEVCNWIGVTCGARHRRVTALNLINMGLSGTVPPHLGNLSFLVMLNFSHNSFHGTLPGEVSRLHRLERIDFRYNNLTGDIPSGLGFLPKLELLRLNNNLFSGSIPSSLFNKSSLRHINLNHNQLSGTIPRQIGNLTTLEELWLNYNNFAEIPREIGNLQLEELNLQGNVLERQIPLFLFNMSSLIHLDLNKNRLHGSLPDNICQHLPVIQGIYLASNQLSGSIPSKWWQCKELLDLEIGKNFFSGSIPQNLGNLTRIRYIFLAYNNLTGTIPNEIGNLHKLEDLTLLSNNLHGPIPPSIFNISTLRLIRLSFNKLSGHLPPTIGISLPNLRILYLSNNSLSGAIPTSISNASNLIHLEMMNNYLFGFVPNTLSSLRNLQELKLARNNFTSDSIASGQNILSANFANLKVLYLSYNPLNVTIPLSMGNLSTSLQFLYLRDCKLRGNVPNDIANLSTLIGLNLADNRLEGSIPCSVGKLQKLQYFRLSDNMLHQSIPLEICHMLSLNVLNLENNKLQGSIPTCMGNISTFLRELYLGSNKLTSGIPSSLWGLEYILKLDLSSNYLNGSLPEVIKNLQVVIVLNISNNQLSGNIPYTIGGIQHLAILSLENNNLQGPIPDSFGNSLSMEWLDLSKNYLSGEIPKSLEKLFDLKYFNVSYNKLYGEIPTEGSFANFSSQSFMSNDGLCGAPRFKVPPCKRASRAGTNTFFLRYILPSLLVLILIMALVIMLILRRRRNARCESAPMLLPQLSTLRRVSYHELLRATSGFNDGNLLGTGTFGSVYKGTLSDGTNIAVKVFNLQLENAFHSFDVECEVLSNIRHRNLIKIVTSCSSPHFKALLLDYMPLGSLEKWLHSNELCLNLLERLNIMIDVASAMEYLHHGYSVPIVHCDLKPNNVLLDEDMVARVADFGIARLLSGGDSMTHTMTLATIGYMAPELGLEGIVSRRGDVYSYGVMLMETFTRKRPTDEMFSGEMSLKQWVENSFSHDITDVIDSNLLSTIEEHYTSKKDCLSSVMELALACSATSPEERTDMKNVAATLKKIKAKFLKDVEE